MHLTTSLRRWIQTSRVRLTLLFGSMALLAASALAIYADHQAIVRLQRHNGEALVMTGQAIAAALAEGMRERQREINLLSRQLLSGKHPLDATTVQSQLEDIQRSFPFYSWIGITDANGTVLVSTGQLLLGNNVAQRPWFAQGLKGPYSGDAHEAVLLDSHLRPHNSAEPLRFLDFAAPLLPAGGSPTGVVGAHLNWNWVTRVVADHTQHLNTENQVDVLISNQAGEYLHPYQQDKAKQPTTPLPPVNGYNTVTWGSDGAFLTAVIQMPASPAHPLEWRVLVRQPIAVALAPAKTLHQIIAVWAVGLTALLMLMTYWVAARFSRPLEQLAEATRHLDETGQGGDFNIPANTLEFAHLRDALRNLTQHLLQSQRQLEQKVLDRTEEIRLREQEYLGILEDQTEIICRFQSDFTLTYVNEAYCRMFALRREDVLGRVWAPVVHPDDLGHVTAMLTSISEAQPVVQIENRVISGSGQVRWCQFVNRAYFDPQGHVREWQTVGRDITASKLLEAEIQHISEELQDLYDRAPCGYYSVNAQGLIVRINDLALDWMGTTREDVLGRTQILDFLDAAGQITYQEHFPEFVERGQLGPIELNLMGRHGITRRISLTASAIRDPSGQFVMSRSVMYDVSELFMMRYQLRQLNAEQAAMLDNDLLGIAKVYHRKIVWRNKALERIFGYEPGELLDMDTSVMYCSRDEYEQFGREAYAALEAGQHYRKQMEMRKKNGDPIWLDLNGVRLSDETGESLWLLQDISEMKQYQAQVEHIAFHDPLTNLPNRLLLSDRLRLAMALNDRMGTLTAVCYLDLDGFKPVNDDYGHEAGDQVLKEIARRLQDTVRANDTVARLGGDEFALLLTHLTHQDEAALVIQRVTEAVARPIVLNDGHQVRVSTSVGTALYPLDGRQPASLFTKADQAMYAHKKNATKAPPL